jgi:hypothetical protein
MKKLLSLMYLTAAAMLFSPVSYADHGWGHDDHGWGHHGHHHHHGYYPQPQINYYPQPQINYYPAPQINYYPQPQVNYYQRQAQYSDPRSHQGLAGGVIGSVFGYELGSGDPIATGLGAAAGSFLGNGMNGGYPGR